MMQANLLKARQINLNKNNNGQEINSTLKGVLLNTHIKNPQNQYSFNDIQNSLLIFDNDTYQKEYTDKQKQESENESSFDAKKAIKPIIVATGLIAGGCFLTSLLLKHSMKNIVKSKNFEKLPDIGSNMNIKDETEFALYRAIREPNYSNILGAFGVIFLTGVTIASKKLVDGVKEVWTKKREADIEKRLQENLIEVEKNSFSGKLKVVNTMLAEKMAYFNKVLNGDSGDNIFKRMFGFKGQIENNDKNENNKPKNKDLKFGLMAAAALTGAIILGAVSILNIKKTAKISDKYANNFVETVKNKIDVATSKANKDDLPDVIEYLKLICAKPDYVEAVGKKYGLSGQEIDKINQGIEEAKRTIFANAPTALGGIPEKIQYYCYIDEPRGHFYNWIVNPTNKFTKYIFMTFSLSAAAGYIFKQSADAIKNVAVLNENSKTELDLRKRLVDVEIANFKAKKESAIEPIMDNFKKQAESGEKSKDELKQLADNILTEIKNGPPYVYS